MAWIDLRRGKHRVYWNNKVGITPRRDSLSFDTRADAELFLELIAAKGNDPLAARAFVLGEDRPDAAELAPAVLTLKRLGEVFIASKTGVYGSTQSQYETYLELHIERFFGPDFDVTRLRATPSLMRSASAPPESVSEWLAWMKEQYARTSSGKVTDRKLSAKTIRNVHGVLSEMLELAVEDPDVALPRNPCAASKLPKADAPVEMQFLEKWQFALFLKLFDPFWWPLLLTLVMTGIRWGEAAALQRKNLKLDAKVPYLYVCKALRRPKGLGWLLARPKTESSVRSIPLNAKAVEMLRTHVAGLGPNDFVFQMNGGGMLHNSNFNKRAWQKAVKAAQAMAVAGHDGYDFLLPEEGLRIHDLRHTHASWLASEGRPLQSIQDRLGHSDIKTTRRYSHLTKEVASGDLKVLDDAYPELELSDETDEDFDSLQLADAVDAEELALPVMELADDDDLAA